MSAFLYDKARQSYLEGGLAWLTDSIKILLVTAGYVASQSTHQFVSDVGGGNIVARSSALISKTSTAGVANANNTVISAVSGSVITALVWYKDTGVDATSNLIAYDQDYSGLPFTPSGVDITVVFPADLNKIFKL